MRALIIGVSGQDGAYLAELLLSKGYEVHGTSRDANLASFANLVRLGIRERVRLLSVAPNDFRSVLSALVQVEPDEVYNLSGQSSVGLSFDQPVETMESISIATLNLLEAIRFTGQKVRFYSAGSGECFGDTGGRPATEDTPFRPRSPYAVAKAAAHFEVANYREAYGLFACSGMLFNHESPLRPERFVTRKIVATACRIAAGSGERLRLGNTRVKRDWGWSPEYVDAMWRMLQQERPDDYVIATGETRSLDEFVAAAFRAVALDARDHVDVDRALFRPADIEGNWADPGKAARVLGWRATVRMEEAVRRMVAAERGAPVTAAIGGARR
ncbi:MAG TPA: GDP-mannose 4,6-dehydratase [Anaeromyxobacter sp.]|nr:GDP-mannose 4,6-dehydratase [Anaeromyxobacter sp.]